MKKLEEVKASPVHPAIWYQRGIIDQIFRREVGRDAVLTSSVRVPSIGGSSLHPYGMADDWRTRDLTHEMQRSIAEAVREELPESFDVVLEGPASRIPRLQTRDPHLHVEYQPKFGDSDLFQ